MNGLVKKFGKRVAFTLRHFPLNIHPEADEAAQAVECAREQGRFLEYQRILFNRQRAQKVPQLKSYARQAGVKDTGRFDGCLDSGKTKQRVQRDFNDGMALEISGTPAMVIGRIDPQRKVLRGELIVGARSARELEAAVRKYLAQSGK